MPITKLTVTRNGVPVEGAKVIVGDKMNGTTDFNGQISKDLPEGMDIAVPIIVKKDGEFSLGMGCVNIIAGEDLTIEV